MASIYKPSGAHKYQIAWYDETGRRRRRAGTADKTSTRRIADKIETDLALRRDGVIDAEQERQARLAGEPVAVQVQAFAAALEGKGDTDRHVRQTVRYLELIFGELGVARLADLDPGRLAAQAAQWRAAGLGARAINARLGAAKTFSRWLFRTARLRTDPLASVARQRAEGDPRYQRRALSEAEIEALLTAAEKGPPIRGLTGPERAMLYRLALETGLRASEARSLTSDSFDLADTDRASVAVAAGYSKHRRRDTLPLRRETARALRAFLADREPGRPVWPLGPRAADVLRVDLAAAGIEAEDRSGRVVDFHALRHTFISRLAWADVHVKTAQRLARHSDANLTLSIYSHLRLDDERGALDRLPLPGVSKNAKAARKGAG